MTEGTPVYEWDIIVKRYNTYGDQVAATTPTKVFAADKDEVTRKVRAMFNATYDDFREFWSHGWQLKSVQEVAGGGS